MNHHVTLEQAAQAEARPRPWVLAAWDRLVRRAEVSQEMERRRAAQKVNSDFNMEISESLDHLAFIDDMLRGGLDAQKVARLMRLGVHIESQPTRFVAIRALRQSCALILSGSNSPDSMLGLVEVTSLSEEELSCALLAEEVRSLGYSCKPLTVHENLAGAVADALNVAIEAGVGAFHESRRQALLLGVDLDSKRGLVHGDSCLGAGSGSDARGASSSVRLRL
jgi:hypothetical protein